MVVLNKQKKKQKQKEKRKQKQILTWPNNMVLLPHIKYGHYFYPACYNIFIAFVRKNQRCAAIVTIHLHRFSPIQVLYIYAIRHTYTRMYTVFV